MFYILFWFSFISLITERVYCQVLVNQVGLDKLEHGLRKNIFSLFPSMA